MDQQEYLKSRMQKAYKIADELGYMIEHTLGVSPKTMTDVPNISLVPDILDFRNEHEKQFQGIKLYKLMKNFVDLSLKKDENGEYPEEVINGYLEDMAEFSFHPKHDGDVFQFNIQDHVYKVEVVMEGIVSMTLLINDEWIQTRIIKKANDFAALMRIMDDMKGMYETNSFIKEADFVKFYKKVVRIADENDPEWRSVEKKVFVPYSMQNDIYISPYNSEEFMSDFIEELENSKSRLSEIVDLKEREAIETYLNFLAKWKAEALSSDLSEIIKFGNVFKEENTGNVDIFSSEFFRDILKRMSKKHNVVNRLKELAEELKTFSDLKSVEEQSEEAEKEYGYEAVKQYLIDKNKDLFLSKAVLMTPIDSVNIANYIAYQSDEFIFERVDIFIELTMTYIIPLQEEHYNRIWSIISSDPINLIRKVNPEMAESIFGDKEFDPVEFDHKLFNEVKESIEKVAKVEEKLKEENTVVCKNIAKEILEEMDELVDQGKVEKQEPTESDKTPEYFQLAFNKAVDKLVKSGIIEKLIAEATKE